MSKALVMNYVHLFSCIFKSPAIWLSNRRILII